MSTLLADREDEGTTTGRRQRPTWSPGPICGLGMLVSVTVLGTGASVPVTPPETFGPWTVEWSVSGTEPARETATPAEAVRRVHDRSGLSWEQVARLFGVSRRSVHNWATGGVMNAENAARLSEISAAFADLPDEPARARDELLAPDPSGVSRYQRLIATRETTQRPEGFAVEQLMGVRRDGEVTVHGEFAGTGEPVDLEHGWPRRRQ